MNEIRRAVARGITLALTFLFLACAGSAVLNAPVLRTSTVTIDVDNKTGLMASLRFYCGGSQIYSMTGILGDERGRFRAAAQCLQGFYFTVEESGNDRTPKRPYIEDNSFHSGRIRLVGCDHLDIRLRPRLAHTYFMPLQREGCE